jgi:hypothetical protein
MQTGGIMTDIFNRAKDHSNYTLTRRDNVLNTSLSDFKSMLALANTDPAMKELLLAAVTYYMMRGSPLWETHPYDVHFDEKLTYEKLKEFIGRVK